MAVILEGHPAYIIFFDSTPVQQFVESWEVSLAINGQPGSATIDMVYCEALADFDYMTDVKVFVKNIFSGRYRMIFEGQLHARSVTVSATGKGISYQCLDKVFWLQRMPLPIVMGVDAGADPLTTLSWQANGVNFNKVANVLTSGKARFENMNLADMLKDMFKIIDDAVNTRADGKEDKNNIYNWIKLSKIVKVLSDVDPSLRSSKLLDLMYQGSVLDNMYVFINDVVSKLGYEMYQDIDGMIKIKEPYWNEGILKNHVIDPILLVQMNESTNWDARYSRVMITGGLDSIYQNDTSGVSVANQLTPAGVFVGTTLNYSQNGYFVGTDNVYSATGEIPKEDQQAVKGEIKPSIAAGTNSVTIANIALKAADSNIKYSVADNISSSSDVTPTEIGGASLVYWAYNQAGITVPYRSVVDICALGGYKNQKKDWDNIKMGDLGVRFKGRSATDNHIAIYCGVIDGKHCWVNPSPSRGKVVRDMQSTIKASWMTFYIPYLDVIGSGYGSPIAYPVGDQVKNLYELTEIERRFGISLFQGNQPLIKKGM